MQKLELLRLARLGAAARLSAIDQERQAILRAFPGLRAGTPPTAGAPEAGTPRKRRRRLSAAARKRISDAQKARWAKHRRAKSA